MSGDKTWLHQIAAGAGGDEGPPDHVATERVVVDGLVLELVITVRREHPGDEVPMLELEPVRRPDASTRRPRQVGREPTGRPRRWPWAALAAGSVVVALGVAALPRPASHPATVTGSIPAAAVGSESAGACATRPGGCTTEEYRSLVGSMLATIGTIPRDCRARAGGCTTEEYRTNPARLWPRPTNP
jgi:hypothetical protein